MAVRIIQRNGQSVRAWFSAEFAGQAINGPIAQEGEGGYLIDTDQEGVYRNGVWIFYPSQRQVLQEIRTLLEETPAPAVYDDDNPLPIKEIASAEVEMLLHFSNAATSTKTPIKDVPGYIRFIEISNPNTVDSFLQLFDVPVRDVTVGTTTPTLSFLIPAGAGTLNRGAFDRSFRSPLIFRRALCYAVTTTPTGSTAPTNNCTLNVGYV